MEIYANDISKTRQVINKEWVKGNWKLIVIHVVFVQILQEGKIKEFLVKSCFEVNAAVHSCILKIDT